MKSINLDFHQVRFICRTTLLLDATRDISTRVFNAVVTTDMFPQVRTQLIGSLKRQQLIDQLEGLRR